MSNVVGYLIARCGGQDAFGWLVNAASNQVASWTDSTEEQGATAVVVVTAVGVATLGCIGYRKAVRELPGRVNDLLQELNANGTSDRAQQLKLEVERTASAVAGGKSSTVMVEQNDRSGWHVRVEARNCFCRKYTIYDSTNQG